MSKINPFYQMLPANSGIQPVLSTPLQEFSHVYLSFSGFIRVIGEIESGLEELYALTCAEANNSNWTPIMRDAIELLIWTTTQDSEFTLNRRIENSQFFGPKAIVKELIPSSLSIILTKRDTFEENPVHLNYSGLNKWSTAGVEWIMEIQLKGVVKKLSEFEKLTACKNQLSQYAKADRFSPYNSMSSYNAHSNIEVESSNSAMLEQSNR